MSKFLAVVILTVPGLAFAEAPQAGSSVAVFATRQAIFSSAPRAYDTGGRLQAQLGMGSWAVAVRGDATALPGTELIGTDPRTYRAVEGYLSVSRYVTGRQGVAIGPALWIGSSVGYDLEGSVLAKPHPFTWGAGARLGGPGAWALVGAGQHSLLADEWAVIVAAHVPFTSRLSAIGDGVFGGRGSWVRFGVAVTLAASDLSDGERR